MYFLEYNGSLIAYCEQRVIIFIIHNRQRDIGYFERDIPRGDMQIMPVVGLLIIIIYSRA